MNTPLNIHASCVVLGEAGVLIRGETGVGKSSLAVRLVAARRASGGFAALVSDDRTLLSASGGRLVARPHAATVGLVERRGLGIRAVPFEPAAVVRLVVDLQSDRGPRMPSEEDRRTLLAGLVLPRLAGSSQDVWPLVDEALSWPG